MSSNYHKLICNSKSKLKQELAANQHTTARDKSLKLEILLLGPANIAIDDYSPHLCRPYTVLELVVPI